MSSYKYICFDCKNYYRRDASARKLVLCAGCGKQCVCIGVKIPIPPKNKPQRWTALRKQLSDNIRDRVDNKIKEKVATQHALEREIIKLERLPYNPGRASLVKQLKSRLAALNE